MTNETQAHVLHRLQNLYRSSLDESRLDLLVCTDSGEGEIMNTLICGWCAYHRKGDLNDGAYCVCGGRSWLICTLGCLDNHPVNTKSTWTIGEKELPNREEWNDLGTHTVISGGEVLELGPHKNDNDDLPF